MTEFSANKLRALDEQHRTRLITTLRNWQREMERSCDALRELGPDMEDAAMGNAHVAEALEEAADAILAMAEERERSEKHRNDLADRITDQSITIGALKADNARMREALESVLKVRVNRDDNIWAGADRCRDIARRALAEEKAS